ncbi:MAG: FHA domain-containing protein [Planctomycetaceae bacterium]
MRLILVGLLATLVACQSANGKKESKVTGGRSVTMSYDDRDAVERALASLGIDGAIHRLDLNDAKSSRSRKLSRVTRVHLLSDLILLETAGSPPGLYALERDGLQPAWYSNLEEPSLFPATESADAIFIVSAHRLHALSSHSGERVMRFLGGSLDGLARPTLELPFTPTGSAAGQQDTVYVGTLGSPDNNKTLESFSLVSGQRGWGYRTQGNLLTAPVVGGDASDPKLYFVSDTGILTCMDAENYGYTPRGHSWQETIDAGSDVGICLTPDSKREAGALYLADAEGGIYCFDRITGVRRWSHASGKRPTATPQVMGDFLVVGMKSGLSVYEKSNFVYGLRVATGPDEGKVLWVRGGKVNSVGNGPGTDIRLSDSKVAASHFTLEVQGEVLAAMIPGKNLVQVNGRKVSGRAALLGGQRLVLGGTVLEVLDRRGEPLLTDLAYESAVGLVGGMLVLAKGTSLTVLDPWTGAVQAGPVSVPKARFFPANTSDGNLFVVVGDARVYALFPR